MQVQLLARNTTFSYVYYGCRYSYRCNQKAGIAADYCSVLYLEVILRMRGMYAVNTGTAGTINFVQGSAAGTSRLKFNTVAQRIAPNTLIFRKMV